jgi:hypothetical protein
MRKHPLTIGEIVFDVNTRFFGVIVELTDDKAVLDMNGMYNNDYVPKDLPLGWCEKENRQMFDCEIEENELKWETNELDDLYQVNWNVVDEREENYVCYEHNEMNDDYPYYSPYLDENLFYFETKEI